MKLVKRIFHKLGYNISPVSGIASQDTSKFYKPSNTCQIPELSDLYKIFLGEKNEGLFIEVGAYDGISFSNSSCLANVGWDGILIEPIPEYAELCRKLYKDNKKIKVIENAIGSENKSVTITKAGSYTTTDENIIAAYENIAWAKGAVKNATKLTVSQRTLDTVLKELALEKTIDVLIVDVEGKEKEVFQGFDLAYWKPRMIIAELAHTHPDLHEISGDDSVLQKYIIENGYSIIYKDSVNTVFLTDSNNP